MWSVGQIEGHMPGPPRGAFKAQAVGLPCDARGRISQGHGCQVGLVAERKPTAGKVSVFGLPPCALAVVKPRGDAGFEAVACEGPIETEDQAQT